MVMDTSQSSIKIETLRWRDNCLEMIDQRILPATFKYIKYDSAEGVANGIRDMVVRGAPAIGVAAAYGIAVESKRLRHGSPVEFKDGLEKGFDFLSKSRPTAVNLFWALERMRKVWLNSSSNDNLIISEELLQEAHVILSDDIRINRKMGQYGAELLPDGSRVLTHCNAGALVTAGHGAALGVFRSAVEAGKKMSVIADNMAGFMMSSGEIDAVVVGTDRVAANGDVANKIGTYMVAVLAKRHNIPFYVACPLSTIDLNVSNGTEIPIEERSPEEVKGFRGYHWAAEGVSIRNPSFDITPAELVTALITEQGVIYNPNAEKLSQLF